MRNIHIVLLVCIHVLAFNMALLEFLLNCFRRRKPQSKQDRPLVQSADSSAEQAASDHLVRATEHCPQTPPGVATDLKERPVLRVSLPIDSQLSSANVDPPVKEANTADLEVAGPLTPQVPCPVLSSFVHCLPSCNSWAFMGTSI